MCLCVRVRGRRCVGLNCSSMVTAAAAAVEWPGKRPSGYPTRLWLCRALYCEE